MIKKKITCLILVLLGCILSACDQKPLTHTRSIFALDTYIMIQIGTFPKDKIEVEKIFDDLTLLYEDYHKLTTRFEEFYDENNNLLINNVATINRYAIDNEGTWVEIDERLFELLKVAYEWHNVEGLLFNILIGGLTELWKTEFEKIEDDRSIPKGISQQVEIMNNSILEFNNDDKKVRIIGGAQLDLGAIVKGYVTQLAIDYITSNKIEYFFINAGSSSIHVGNNIVPESNKNFSIDIIRPPFGFGTPVRRIYLRDKAISTSAMTEQNYLIGEDLYSHLINPITGSAKVENIGLISVISESSIISEIFTTGLFHLSLNEIIDIYTKFDIEFTILVVSLDGQVLYESEGIINYV